jgi:hypothetical protein
MRKSSLAILFLFLFVTSVSAANVSIVQLSEYTSSNSFKLSCSALTDPGSTAQFSFKKEGGSYSNFGSVINLDSEVCQVQVTSIQVDEQTKYYFKVDVSGAGSAETSTFYDISGPSGVSNYYKEQVGSGFYKLHWKNSEDSDFSKVIIYRGETADFSADASHEIAQVSGGAGSDMTYDEHQPDPNKTYYYALRAIDKAGNSSSLVGDAGTTTGASPIAGSGSVAGVSTGGSGGVNVLPVEEGEVLGDEGTPSPEAVSTEGVLGGIGAGLSTLQKAGIGLGILVVLLGIYFFAKRNKS